jgi:hypothetical protein
MTSSLNEQIAEVERELALRSRVYPGLVAKNKMRQSEADEHTRRMQAVLATLRSLRSTAEKSTA